MARVITFSRTFPAYHPKVGQPTYFVEKLWKSLECIGFSAPPYHFTELSSLGSVISGENYNHAWPKHHTIRSGNRWKAGDCFSPRVWSGKPYASPMIAIAPDIKIEKVWEFKIEDENILVNQAMQDRYLVKEIAKNDGLDIDDLIHWFKYPKPFTGQIICWNKEIEY